MDSYRSPWMDDELDMYRDSVRRFVQAEMVPNDEKWRKQQHVDPEIWIKAGEMGFLLTDVPEQYGGMGADFRYEAVLYEEMAGAALASFGQHVHSILANYLVNHGTEEQKMQWLPRMASGELVGAIAMSEPSAGSDLQGVRTVAVRDGDEYVIDGSKIFISNGYLAGLIGVVCKTDPSQGAKGTSIIMVETEGQEGFKVGRILDKIGQKGQDTCELFFDNVRVPAANLLGGAEGHGFYQLMSDLPYERLACAVSGVAAIEHALDLTVEYTGERKAFGQRLIEMQNTRFKLAEVKTVARIARVFVDHCIERLVAGTLDTETASMAKYWISEIQCETVDECLQLFGGYGYMQEYPIARLYADARVQRIYAGTNEIMKEIISRSL